jgi:hypothetical protein
MKNSVMTIVFTLILTFSLQAQDRTVRADSRQAAQRVRIADGRRSGEVTRVEAVHLNRQQRHIRRIERRAKTDGEVTVVERRRLNRKQNRANRNIRRAKHNSRDRN